MPTFCTSHLTTAVLVTSALPSLSVPTTHDMNALKCRTLGVYNVTCVREYWKAHVLLELKLALYTAGSAIA